jgi:large subunit ribosomal protein L17
MRHRVRGRKLGLPSDQRMALLKGLVRSMVEHDAIVTTVTRAKETRPMVEKLITTAKANDLHARRLTRRLLNNEDLVHRLFTVVMPRFVNRPGGYTRITRIGRRRGDAAPIAKLEFVGEE